MVDWVEYEPFGAKKKEIEIVNKQAATVESHGRSSCEKMLFHELHEALALALLCTGTVREIKLLSPKYNLYRLSSKKFH